MACPKRRVERRALYTYNGINTDPFADSGMGTYNKNWERKQEIGNYPGYKLHVT